MTEPHIWGLVEGVRTDQAEDITNDKLNQTTDALVARIAAQSTQAELFAQDALTTGGLVWGHRGGFVRSGLQVLAGTVTLAPSATNFVQVHPTTGAVTVNQSAFASDQVALRKLTTDAGTILTNLDVRSWVMGGAVGPTGPAGAQGVAGPTGATGATGPAVTSMPWSAITDVPTATTTSNGVVRFAANGSATSGRAVQADDTRLSDARTPTAHSHTIADTTGLQNALDARLPTSTRGTSNGVASLDGNTRVPTAQLGSGTASASTFLRGDGSWQALAASSDGSGYVQKSYTSGGSTPALSEDEAKALNIEVTTTSDSEAYLTLPAVRRVWRVMATMAATTNTNYHLYVRTSGQGTPGLKIPRGTAQWIECDGTNIVLVPSVAVVGGVAYPITAGAADSAGAGFRQLRIPNS